MVVSYDKSFLLKVYIFITIILHFLYYSLGRYLDSRLETIYLIFSINNIIFSILFFIREDKFKYILAFSFIILSVFYGYLRNGFNLNIITDTVQIVNIFCLVVILKHIDKELLLKAILLLAITSLLAGIVSYFNLGYFQFGFKPISHVAPVFIFYKFLTNKKFLYLLIFILCFFLLLVNGRRTNLILCVLGITLLLLKYKPVLFIYSILTFSIIFFGATHLNKSKHIEFESLNRIIDGVKGKNESLLIRYAEVKSSLKEMNKKPILNFLFGRGVGSTFKLEANFEITDKRILEKIDNTRHIHFSPMNLFFKYGIISILYIIYFCILLINHFREKDFSFFLLSLCILLTLIDSFFRSVFVDTLSLLFIALCFCVQSKFQSINNLTHI